MEKNNLIRKLTSVAKIRKRILSIAYFRGKEKGEQIERWLNIEMLAKLLELKENNKVKQAEGEHQYHNPKKTIPRRYFEHCDLWWKNSMEHWLEVKTIVIHRNYKKLIKHHKNDIEDDLNKMGSLNPPYIFHHLLFVFTYVKLKLETWDENLTSLYSAYSMQKEDQWIIDINKEQTLRIFLYTHVKKN